MKWPYCWSVPLSISDSVLLISAPRVPDHCISYHGCSVNIYGMCQCWADSHNGQILANGAGLGDLSEFREAVPWSPRLNLGRVARCFSFQTSCVRWWVELDNLEKNFWYCLPLILKNHTAPPPCSRPQTLSWLRQRRYWRLAHAVSPSRSLKVRHVTAYWCHFQKPYPLLLPCDILFPFHRK